MGLRDHLVKVAARSLVEARKAAGELNDRAGKFAANVEKKVKDAERGQPSNGGSILENFTAAAVVNGKKVADNLGNKVGDFAGDVIQELMRIDTERPEQVRKQNPFGKDKNNE